MEHETNVIELGNASIETKGSMGPFRDVVLTQPEPTLIDD